MTWRDSPSQVDAPRCWPPLAAPPRSATPGSRASRRNRRGAGSGRKGWGVRVSGTETSGVGHQRLAFCTVAGWTDWRVRPDRTQQRHGAAQRLSRGILVLSSVSWSWRGKREAHTRGARSRCVLACSSASPWLAASLSCFATCSTTRSSCSSCSPLYLPVERQRAGYKRRQEAAVQRRQHATTGLHGLAALTRPGPLEP